MISEQFFNLVASMRDAQVHYFKTPSCDYFTKQKFLNESMKLEKEVDSYIKQEKVLRQKQLYRKQNPIIPGLEEFI